MPKWTRLPPNCGIDAGYIYVVQMEGHQIYKIGRSGNVLKRIGQIGIQLPFPYRLCFSYKVPFHRFHESDLHRDFSRFRKNGEWFQLPELALEIIQMRLLYAQANLLAVEIRECFECEDLHPNLIEKYGRLFVGIGKRNSRRLLKLESLEKGFIDEYIGLDALSAEGLT